MHCRCFKKRIENIKGAENAKLEATAPNFPSIMRELDIQIQETPKNYNEDNWTETQTDTHHKLPKITARTLNAVKEKWLIMYKGPPIRLSVNFLAEILQARSMGKKPAWGEMTEKWRFLLDKEKLEEFIPTGPVP